MLKKEIIASLLEKMLGMGLFDWIRWAPAHFYIKFWTQMLWNHQWFYDKGIAIIDEINIPGPKKSFS